MLIGRIAQRCSLSIRLAIASLILLGPVLDASFATATTLQQTGKWVSSGTDGWGSDQAGKYAIHMMIARGEGNPHHSHILWFSHDKNNVFYGNEVG